MLLLGLLLENHGNGNSCSATSSGQGLMRFFCPQKGVEPIRMSPFHVLGRAGSFPASTTFPELSPFSLSHAGIGFRAGFLCEVMPGRGTSKENWRGSSPEDSPGGSSSPKSSPNGKRQRCCSTRSCSPSELRCGVAEFGSGLLSALT